MEARLVRFGIMKEEPPEIVGRTRPLLPNALDVQEAREEAELEEARKNVKADMGEDYGRMVPEPSSPLSPIHGKRKRTRGTGTGFPTEAQVEAREDQEARDISTQSSETKTPGDIQDVQGTEGDMGEGEVNSDDYSIGHSGEDQKSYEEDQSSTFFSDLGHHIDVFVDGARKHLEKYWIWYLIAIIIILIIAFLLWHRKRLLAICKSRRTRQEMIEDILEI